MFKTNENAKIQEEILQVDGPVLWSPLYSENFNWRYKSIATTS